MGISQRVVSFSIKGKGLPRGISPGFKVGDSVDSEIIEAGKEHIRRQLFDRGFWPRQVTVETAINENGVAVTYLVDSVMRARLGGWSFEGVSKVIPVPLAGLPSRGTVITARVINKLEEKTAKAYRDAGFPWASVSVAGIGETAGFLFPIISVDTGPRVIVKFITFGGNLPSSDSLLIRYTGFKQYVPYSLRVVVNWRRGLEKSGWVVVDSQDIVMRREGDYGVRYWISAYRSGEVFGSAGYLSEERYWTGWVKLRLLNLMNSGRKVEGEWRSFHGFSYYSLNYSEPWLFRLPVELQGSVEHNVLDTSYSFTTLSVTGTYTTGNTSFSVGAGFDRIAGIESNTTRWLGSGLIVDYRDRVVNTRSGFWARLFSRAGQRRSGEKEDVITKLELDFEPAVPLVGNFVLVNHFAARTAFARYDLSVPELYQVGGILNVRGYRDAAYVTPKTGWWNCELRYNFSAWTRVQIFFDAGVFQNLTDGYQGIAGYGLGGRWQTKVGVVGLDYGLAWGKSIGQGKVHFSFGAGF